MVEPEQVLCRDRRAGEAAASPCSRFGAWRRATSWQECMGSRLTPRPSFLRLKRCPLHGPGREGPLTKRGCVSAWLLGLTAACSSSSIASWCFVPPSSGTNEQCQQSTPVAIQTELGLGDGTTCPAVGNMPHRQPVRMLSARAKRPFATTRSRQSPPSRPTVRRTRPAPHGSRRFPDSRVTPRISPGWVRRQLQHIGLVPDIDVRLPGSPDALRWGGRAR